jgi:hypothetical protein
MRSAFAIRSAVLGLAAAAIPAGPASAQNVPPERVAVTVTGGYVNPAAGFTQNVTFEQYSEQGTLAATYTAPSRPSVDGGGTVRVWRGLAVGVAGWHYRDSGTAQVTASVPHPIIANSPRQISGPANVTHSETAVHVQAAYWLRVSPQVTVIFEGGPSFFNVSQDFVSDVTYTQAFPYTTATYQGATTVRHKQSATGYNVGGEGGWRVWGQLSVVGAVRYSHATATFTDALAQPMTLGGLHVGAGIRLMF